MVPARTVLLLAVAGIEILLAGCQKTETPGKSEFRATPVDSGPSVDADGSSQAPRRTLSREELLRAVELRNRGIGHLENKEWQQAEAALSELARLMPDNRLAVRNLAISRVLRLLDPREPEFNRSKDPAAYAGGLAAAQDAIQKLRAASPDDQALCDQLEGRLRVGDDSTEKPSMTDGLKLLRQAAVASGDQPEYWFAVAMAMDGHRDYGDSAELLRVLNKVHSLVPQNLFALQKLIERQSLALNSTDAEVRQEALQLAETLQDARKLIAPLNESIRRQRRVNLVETIDKALIAYNGSNPASLMGPAMMTKNLLLPEIATQIDGRRIDRHLLDYLLLEFDPAMQQQLQAARVTADPAATVLKPFVPGTGLPPVSGATQVESLDLDLDGNDDLVLACGGRIQVYSRGIEPASDWKLLLESSADAGPFTHFLLADIDRDNDRAISDLRTPVTLLDRDGDRRVVKDPAGQRRWFDTDADVIAWSEAGLSIVRNNAAADGSRKLELIPQKWSLTGIRTVAAADLEADGDLDLIVATNDGLKLLRNLDGSGFELIADGLEAPPEPLDALAIGDWNRDVAMDVVGVSATGSCGFLENLLHSRFRWVTGQDGLEHVSHATSARIGDFDGNLSWDLLTGGEHGLQIGFTEAAASGVIHSLKQLQLTSEPVSGFETADLDNDGSTDIIGLTKTGVLLFRGHPDGTFDNQTELLPPTISAAGVCTTDDDNDGDLDLVLISPADGSLSLLMNEGGNQNNWLDVVVRGKPDDPQFVSQRVNMHAIGAVLELRAGAACQAHIVDSPRLHLGLGQSTAVDALRVIWTDGVPQNIVTPEHLRSRIGILAPQILKGSCPYLYTWNGERFEFFSDCLWAAPIGLVQASGDLAPTREWEYLLISGEQLAARDNRYVLQFTEELWETGYLDEVTLAAVDHPADVSVFTNEKVGSPEMAAHRIHTVRDRRLPRSVTDGEGRNLLPGLTAQDGDYVQPFRGRIMQGLTDTWTMEFDPGPLDQIENLRLVLIGWVFPTDTSLNVAIFQNPQLEAPLPPSIEVPDATGQWQVVRPFIGFPSGKTKAMVVDLTDIFITDDHRFRIRSSMELYWDAAFFIVNEHDAPTAVQPCPLVSANLHYRGFSRRTYAENALFRNGHAPEGYDYQQVTTEPRWPTLAGRFTRYGEPTELLKSQDDRMVVMGPGDELTLEFQVPSESPPEGWKRDFVLYNVGWDKDADLNTVYGQSSEPYPTADMARYPESEGALPQTSDEHRNYLERWQTREYLPRRFRNLVRDGRAAADREPDPPARP